ncbi:PREDICTED: uncharacterized protein LOC109129831 [Camelina sativa]|uniref:Uncharacterized protein LOC109129831 n=1 Tax=Camelina sativa TaxID=90675 RepID=A0ABM1R5D3_CAMSA|nr:PREDICTED: uncharacterized protein LOC109129831 [Camelina sativa]
MLQDPAPFFFLFKFSPFFSPFVQAFQALLNSFYPDGCLSSKGQRWFPVNSLSQLLSAPQEQKHLQVSELQKSDLLSDLKFSRSVLHFTPEEPSPWASLLAGGISLGPVDAPCSGETSTAQGDLLLGATAKQSETSKSSCLPAVTSDQTHTKLLMHRVLPMSPCSRQNFQPSPASRLGLSLLIAKDRLGLPLVDPQSVFGPLRPQLIKPNKCASIPNPLKPRYDLISKLSKLKPSRRCDQDYDAYGFHRRSNSLLLLWRNFHLLKTLVSCLGETSEPPQASEHLDPCSNPCQSSTLCSSSHAGENHSSAPLLNATSSCYYDSGNLFIHHGRSIDNP